MRYQAIITREGTATLAEFPDCPGCQTFAPAGEDVAALAAEALVGWLETGLAEGDDVPVPRRHIRAPRGARLLAVSVPATLAVRILLRRARVDAGLTQAQLARKAGVSQQAIAKLEHPDSNPTLSTLEKVAAALGLTVDVALAAA